MHVMVWMFVKLVSLGGPIRRKKRKSPALAQRRAVCADWLGLIPSDSFQTKGAHARRAQQGSGASC